MLWVWCPVCHEREKSDELMRAWAGQGEGLNPLCRYSPSSENEFIIQPKPLGPTAQSPPGLPSSLQPQKGICQGTEPRPCRLPQVCPSLSSGLDTWRASGGAMAGTSVMAELSSHGLERHSPQMLHRARSPKGPSVRGFLSRKPQFKHRCSCF